MAAGEQIQGQRVDPETCPPDCPKSTAPLRYLTSSHRESGKTDDTVCSAKQKDVVAHVLVDSARAGRKALLSCRRIAAAENYFFSVTLLSISVGKTSAKTPNGARRLS
jgi:hypothetical protein